MPIVSLEEKAGFRRISLAFPPELREGLRLGASVGLDGTCFSVVRIEDSSVSFEATAATLEISNLGDRMLGDSVNVEHSAVLGQENSGHQMSGHIFGTDVITEIEAKAERNYMWFTVPEGARNTSFQRGFLGLNGASPKHLSVYQASPELRKREAFEEEFYGAAEAAREPGEPSAGELGRLTVRSFFSAGIGLLA